jgi:hypothetical protein
MLSRVLIAFRLFLCTALDQTDNDTWRELIKGARAAQQGGEYRRAKELCSRAVVVGDSLDDGGTRRTESKLLQAELLLQLGEYRRCEQLCVESIAAIKKQFGEHDLQIAHAETILTGLYLQLEVPWLANQHCILGLKIRQLILGNEHPDTAELKAAMRHIWNLHSSFGDPGGAKDALKTLEQSFGNLDPRLIVPLEALAGDCYDRWTPKNAARAVSLAKEAYGKQHPVYGRCLLTYATALRNRRNFTKSELISTQAIEVLSDALGPDHPALFAAYRNLASIEHQRGHSAQSAVYFQDSLRRRFFGVTDSDLCYFFDQFVDSDRYNMSHEVIADLYLAEMTRRGGDIVQTFLERKIELYRQKCERAAEDIDQEDADERIASNNILTRINRIERYSRNLQFVTVLCRIQKRPEPLLLSYAGPAEIGSTFPQLPVFEVTISNVDTEKRDIGFTVAGDYRSGRQARWRIEVTDSTGKVRVPKKIHGIVFGGGLYQSTRLKPGEGWQTSLTMARYVDKLEPGEYEVRILYHDALTIVDRESVEGLVLCRSNAIRLTVERRLIEITKEQQQQIKELLEEFDDQQLCKVIDGNYGPWAHDFIDPKSPYGQILTLGWVAVPALIEELLRDEQTLERRAHLLALLFSSTGENDPRSQELFRGSSALGRYLTLDQGWSICSKRKGEHESGVLGYSVPSDPSTFDGGLYAESQEPLIERWKTFRKDCELILRK